MSSSMTDFRANHGIYPVREEDTSNWLEKNVTTFVKGLQISSRSRQANINAFVIAVDRHEQRLREMDDLCLQSAIRELRARVKHQGLGDNCVPELFAFIREVADRTLGMRHYREQIIGGWAMVNGMVAEMDTGQGKTLTATLAAGSAALLGVPTHVVTVNDYLAERDAQTMSPLYQRLELTVGIVTEDMDEAQRRAAYRSDITYCTNKTIAFDYLRDRMKMGGRTSESRLKIEGLYKPNPLSDELILRGLHFAIVDEADSVLVDEAATPLIISKAQSTGDKEAFYQRALALASELVEGEHYTILRNYQQVDLSKDGKRFLSDRGEELGGLWKVSNPREELVVQALKALHLFEKDKHYLVTDEAKVQIIDEFTGRVMADRSWERGLHQMVEIKEHCPLSDDRQTAARLSYQRFFRRYLKVAGMSGTVREVKKELWRVYGLKVHRIPPAQENQRRQSRDIIVPTEAGKWQQVVDYVLKIHDTGQPVLVGTRSLGASEHLSELLHDHDIPHRLLNARQDKEEAEIIAGAGELNQITVATNMAGRGTDIKLGTRVAELGGLCVIATERHESQRIDRQLFGRCARQGDKGQAVALVSLEDDLLLVNCPALMLNSIRLLSKLNIFSYSLGVVLFKYAQKIAEDRQYKARRNVLKMDEYYSTALAFTGQLE